MSFKEKCKKKVEDGKASLIIGLAVITFVSCASVCAVTCFNKAAQAYAKPDNTKRQMASTNMISDINIIDIIKDNTREEYHEEYFIEVKDLEYLTSYQDNPEIPKGMVQVLQEGRDGSQKVTTKKTYKNGELVGEEIVSSQITRAAVEKIVQVGTGRYTSNYKVKVGDTLYVTANSLGILPEPNQDTERIMTIYKDSEVQLLEIDGEWYKIAYTLYSGYCPANCLTYLKPKSKLNEDEGSETLLTKDQLLARLSFDMDLTKPSGLTLEQFRQVLSNNSQDRNGIFERYSDYFYYAEKQYNVNGIFIAAVGIHESGWGTSSICVNKKNLFGYGAYDRDPYTNAYSYSGYESSIDLIARVFAKYYLNPAGTVIYDGQVATGGYYHGATLSGVNTKYATDQNWANSVYYWMKYLYNNL